MVCKNFGLFALGLISLQTLSLVGNFALAESTTQDWKPAMEFTDRGTSGNLFLHRHPLSPTECGIEIIELGVKDPEDLNFEPQLALLRDTYDESYPEIAPKVRRIYSYNMPVSSHQASILTHLPLPSVVVDVDEVKSHIIIKLLYGLTRTVLSSLGNPFASGATLTVDQFVDVYLRKRAYYRARALYLLKLLDRHERSDLQQYFYPGELERLIAVGSETEFKDLLITRDYEEFVYMAQNDRARESRIKNYSNLLSTLNREGLIAQPLFRDFVIVYYDPNKSYARKIDLTYSDLIEEPESALLRKNSIANKQGLIPLGIYAIGSNVDRLLQYDFLQDKRVRDRKWVQYLVRLGQNLGTAFIPFPFSLIIRVTKIGAEFVLNKEGRNILADTLRTEGELLSLLDSGVVNLDPALVKTVKAEMESDQYQALNTNIFRLITLKPDNEIKVHQYRDVNASNMTFYLKKRSKSLCKEIEALREGEFRSEYLTRTESINRGFEAFLKYFGFSSDHDYAEERRQIIANRKELIEARRTLSQFDPYLYFLSHETIIEALNSIAQAKDPNDVPLFEELIKKFSDPDLISATMKAAVIHGNGNLSKPIRTYLSKFDRSAEYGIPLSIGDAIHALSKLDMRTSKHPDDEIDQGVSLLNLLAKSKNRSVRILSNNALFQLIEQKISIHQL